MAPVLLGEPNLIYTEQLQQECRGCSASTSASVTLALHLKYSSALNLQPCSAVLLPDNMCIFHGPAAVHFPAVAFSQPCRQEVARFDPPCDASISSGFLSLMGLVMPQCACAVHVLSHCSACALSCLATRADSSWGAQGHLSSTGFRSLVQRFHYALQFWRHLLSMKLDEVLKRCSPLLRDCHLQTRGKVRGREVPNQPSVVSFSCLWQVACPGTACSSSCGV